MDAVIWDLDGTLVDSATDISAAFAWALGSRGHKEPAAEVVRAMIGQPLGDMFAAHAPIDEVDHLVEAYRSRYAQTSTRTTRPFPGITAILGDLRAAGHGQAVATTKRTDQAQIVVRGLGLDIDHVQGTDPPMAHKPAPDVVRAALAAIGASSGTMVGDTPADIGAGRAMGLRTVGVTWGTAARGLLESAGADVVVDDAAALAVALGVS